MFCRHCGAPLNDGQSFCPSCGAQTEEKVNNHEIGGHNQYILALVCHFYGPLGLHNFMMKENKKGVAKILLTTVGALACGIGPVVAAVLTIIDFVKLLIGNYEVNTEKYF